VQTCALPISGGAGAVGAETLHKGEMETKRHLPFVGEARPPRHPPWIRARLPSGEVYFDVRRLVHEQKLHTVCESASCPNIGECWSRRAVTSMLPGGIRHRAGRVCGVPARPA